jgi:hypothetical protein
MQHCKETLEGILRRTFQEPLSLVFLGNAYASAILYRTNALIGMYFQ